MVSAFSPLSFNSRLSKMVDASSRKHSAVITNRGKKLSPVSTVGGYRDHPAGYLKRGFSAIFGASCPLSRGSPLPIEVWKQTDLSRLKDNPTDLQLSWMPLQRLPLLDSIGDDSAIRMIVPMSKRMIAIRSSPRTSASQHSTAIKIAPRTTHTHAMPAIVLRGDFIDAAITRLGSVAMGPRITVAPVGSPQGRADIASAS